VSIARSLLLRASRSKWIESQFHRRAFARRALKRFMPGEHVSAAFEAAGSFASEGLGTVFTSLGERVTRPSEAAAVRDHYLEVLDTIHTRKLPTHISVKLTHLGMTLDRALCDESVATLARRAGEIGSYLWIDIEESQYVDETLDVFTTARGTSDRVGLCLQSYLRRTAADLERLLPLEPGIRLVKGAYREPKEIAFEKKSDTDRSFFELSARLLEKAAEGKAYPVFGTHDLDLIKRIREEAARRSAPPSSWEVHMLYGIRPEEQRALAAAGVPVRVLISYGENWYPWYVRRLAERPANVWFIVKNVVR
jgi:proline dehydrogenase